MTRIFFYYNAPDRIAESAALIGRAYRQKKDVLVYVPNAGEARALDQALWANPSTGFVPHVFASSPLADKTPVILADSTDSRRQTERLFNLSGEVPPGFAAFASVVEIVGKSDEETRMGRERARFYADRGYALQYLNLQKES